MTPREFILIADESTQKGPRYSNFFGGLLISSDRVEPVSSALAEEKLRLNLRNEVKWKKTSRNYLEKYIQLVSFFFNFVRSGDVKVRIMFTPNSLSCHANCPNIIARTNILCFTISLLSMPLTIATVILVLAGSTCKFDWITFPAHLPKNRSFLRLYTLSTVTPKNFLHQTMANSISVQTR